MFINDLKCNGEKPQDVSSDAVGPLNIHWHEWIHVYIKRHSDLYKGV